MFIRICDFFIGIFSRLLYWLGIWKDSDSGPTGELHECTGTECVINENTALLGQPKEDGQEYLRPDPSSRCRPTAYDYLEQSTPSTPSLQSAAPVPLADEVTSSSEDDSDPESDDSDPPAYNTRSATTRSSQGYARASGPGRDPHTAKPVRPIAGSPAVTVKPRPPPPPQPYPRPHH